MLSTLKAQQHPGSYVDPSGLLYEQDDQLLRGILSPFSDFYANLLQTPPVKEMIGRQIIETEIASDNRLIDYPLTLRHRRIKPISFCYEWPAPMLREAALLTLDISLRLVEAGLALKDASPWNIIFDGPRPFFVDFTSIAPEDPNLPWVAYDQFCRFFLFPLALFSVKLGRVARALLMDTINGISYEELTRLLPLTASLRMPWLLSRLHFPQMLLSLIRRVSSDLALGKMSMRLTPNSKARIAFFRTLQRDVRSIPLSHGSHWSRYYSDIQSFSRPAQFNIKQSTVLRILETCRPKTAVDIGCNLGGYSLLAARLGARVTSFDADEESVGLLYRLVRKENLNVLPLVMDVLNPSPACGWKMKEYASAPQRFRSEMALALALVHHLAITQHQTFERIVPALADYTEQLLLTEFVPLDDLHVQELLATLRRDMSWYSLKCFIEALKQEFSKVETFPSYPEGRTLILCKRR